jgi:hypothetical protein
LHDQSSTPVHRLVLHGAGLDVVENVLEQSRQKRRAILAQAVLEPVEECRIDSFGLSLLLASPGTTVATSRLDHFLLPCRDR